MTVLEWRDEKFLLGVDDMDTTHQEFVALLNRLSMASEAEFPGLFAQFIAHTRMHFSHEEALMQQSGFPATAEHRDEHLRILGELNHFNIRVAKNQTLFARAYIKTGLPDWFRLHASSMDSALAIHLKSKAMAAGVKE